MRKGCCAHSDSHCIRSCCDKWKVPEQSNTCHRSQDDEHSVENDLPDCFFTCPSSAAMLRGSTGRGLITSRCTNAANGTDSRVARCVETFSNWWKIRTHGDGDSRVELPTVYTSHSATLHRRGLLSAKEKNCTTKKLLKQKRYQLHNASIQPSALHGTPMDNYRCCTVLKVGATLLTTLVATQDMWITGSAPATRARDLCLHRHAFPCPEPEFLLAAHVPMSSCTAPRRHGRITHQPEDV